MVQLRKCLRTLLKCLTWRCSQSNSPPPIPAPLQTPAIPPCNLPLEIASTESIVRAVRSSYFKKGKSWIKENLRNSVYKSTRGSDDISVMRHTHLGTDLCKRKAQESFGENYCGLLRILAADILGHGAQIEDTRDEFCGHASLRYGVIMPENDEPLDAETNRMLDNKITAMINSSRYEPDPDPTSDSWTGNLIPLAQIILTFCVYLT